ncbi:MAG: thioredoxin family protein [Verrucomicrobiota bacterium]
MSEVQSTFRLQPGGNAPELTLPDADGNPHTLAELMGANGLVVVFACNHCPYVIHVADALGKCAEQFQESGVATVAINSNDIERYPQDAPEHMTTFAEEHGWNFPYLLDADQSAATAFGAACTPDFFVFDKNRALVYAGQFDDTRPSGNKPAHGGDLAEAVRRLASGESPLVRQYPSSGCNIKWKAGRQPDWWNRG